MSRDMPYSPLLFRPGRGLTAEERRGFKADCDRLKAWLAPARGREAIAALVVPILVSMPAPAAGATADMRAEAYYVALEGCCRNALAEAARAVLRGEVEGIDHRFAPPPPQLAALARAIEGEARWHLRMVEEVLAAPEAPPEPSAEERAASTLRREEKLRQAGLAPPAHLKGNGAGEAAKDAPA